MGNLISNFMNRHPRLKAFIDKIMKDNIGMLASVVAWTLLTSIVPIMVGLLAISGLVLRNAGTRASVISHLSQALQGVLQPKDLNDLANVTIQHTGLLAIIGFLGVLWGGSNVGGAISTVFQPIFETKGRDFLQEKLIDVGMIFVFTALMMVIIVATSSVTLADRLFTTLRLPGIVAFAAGTAVSLLAAFLLFAIIYVVFPNTEPRFKVRSIWPGAALAAVLFQALTYIFPLYSSHANFKHYGAIIGSMLLLTAWIYFFAMILLIGAEIVAWRALREAKAEGRSIGPAPDGTVPQRSDQGEDVVTETRARGEATTSQAQFR